MVSAPPHTKATAKPAPGRVPPHSVEAEEQLLSAILLDGGEMLDRADDAGIAAESFYVPANRVIYARLLAMRVAGKPIDLAVLAEELKATRQLDELGGYAYLTRISDRVPTTAGASFFIEKVRDLALLRDVIRVATGAVENCYNYTGRDDLENIITPLRSAGEGKDSTLDRFRAALLDMANPPAEPEPRFLIDRKSVCTPGNLSVLIAQAKSGKTAFIGAFMAAGMVAERTREGHEIAADIDTLGVEARAPAGRILLHIDTEQSRFDHAQTIRRAARRAGLERPPAWIKSASCAGWSSADLRKTLASVLRNYARKGQKLFAIILDGVADFCADVNDAEESNALVAELHAHAIAADCPILCVMHRNEGDKADSAARGHLGKQLARKAETNLRMEKNDGKTVVFSERNRGAPILEKDGPCFEWSDEKGYHVSSKSMGQSRAEQKRQEAAALLSEAFGLLNELSYSQLREKIMQARTIGAKSAEKWISNLRYQGLITTTPTGQYIRK